MPLGLIALSRGLTSKRAGRAVYLEGWGGPAPVPLGLGMEELRAQNEKLVLEVQAGRRLAYDNAQLLETAAARIVQLEAQVADLVRQNTEAAFTNAKRQEPSRIAFKHVAGDPAVGCMP